MPNRRAETAKPSRFTESLRKFNTGATEEIDESAAKRYYGGVTGPEFLNLRPGFPKRIQCEYGPFFLQNGLSARAIFACCFRRFGFN